MTHTDRIVALVEDCMPVEVATRCREAIDKVLAEVRSEERERCAKLAEECIPACENPPWFAAQRAIAADIRAVPVRREEKPDGG